MSLSNLSQHPFFADHIFSTHVGYVLELAMYIPLLSKSILFSHLRYDRIGRCLTRILRQITKK
jgi:hypothetical protein